MEIENKYIKEKIDEIWQAMCVLDDFNMAMKDTFKEYNCLDSDGAVLLRNYHFIKTYLDKIHFNLSMIYELLDDEQKGEN